MTPYYSANGIQIFHGDCREVMRQLSENFDAIITDPPYGETSLDWDNRVTGWMDEATNRTNSLWSFGSLAMFMEMSRIGETQQWTRSQEIVWEKHNGSSFHADRFKRVHELAVHFYRGPWAEVYKKPVFTNDATKRTLRRKQRPPHTGHIESGAYRSEDGGPKMMRSVIYARSCHGYAEHPTQKPTQIITPLLEYSVPPGGRVLDCFVGSGSTLVAAKAMGIGATGIDIDEKCCEIAAKRLSQEVLQFEGAQ